MGEKVYIKCIVCGGDVLSWREAYFGCRVCGWKNLYGDDVLNEMIKELGWLIREVKRMKKGGGE